MSADRDFCVAMLPKVSRTFALCIRLLPPDLEHPVLLAYLLCRIADTLEDAPTLAGSEKARLLGTFRAALDREADLAPLVAVFAPPGNDEERLVTRADVVLREFGRLPQDQQDRIRPWVQEMCTGMAQFARADGDGGHAREIHALRTVEDLDRYCYYVAGTVGHLLTDLYPTSRRRFTPERHARLAELATSFGLGLQLTNIIKDVADDRARGWSFVPSDLCRQAGIRPDQLHDAGHREAARRVMNVLIEKAGRHLLDAREYCARLPRGQYRIRLFCLTSMLFAVRTLRLARADARLLDRAHKVKITRGAVYRTLAATAVVAPSNLLTRWYFNLLSG